MHSPSFGSIAPRVSGLTGIEESYICWLRKEWNKGEAAMDLFGSNKDIQTESECTRPDFECESSNAWAKILATKLQRKSFIRIQITWKYYKDTI